MNYKILFFGAKPCDEVWFGRVAEKSGFQVQFLDYEFTLDTFPTSELRKLMQQSADHEDTIWLLCIWKDAFLQELQNQNSKYRIASLQKQCQQLQIKAVLLLDPEADFGDGPFVMNGLYFVKVPAYSPSFTVAA